MVDLSWKINLKMKKKSVAGAAEKIKVGQQKRESYSEEIENRTLQRLQVVELKRL